MGLRIFNKKQKITYQNINQNSTFDFDQVAFSDSWSHLSELQLTAI